MPVLGEVTANGDHPPSIFGLRAFGSPVSRAAKRTAPTGSGTVPRPSPRARLEALWKQEGAKCCQFLRNPAHAVRGAGGFKWRKCRRKTEPSAVAHGLFGTAHNLKVVGSNPTPATKFPNVIKRLSAALRGGVCVSATRGSTVEARGAEVLHVGAKTSSVRLYASSTLSRTSWSVGGRDRHRPPVRMPRRVASWGGRWATI